MKKLWIVLLCLIVIGCSTDPVYHTEDEVVEYVQSILGDEYTLEDVQEVASVDTENNSAYHYTFVNNQGMEFTIESTTRHIQLDASETIFYTKELSDDFANRLVEFYIDDIYEIIAEQDNIFWSCGSSTSSCDFYMESMDQLGQVVETIINIDNLYNLDLNFEDYSINVPKFYIYLEPNLLQMDDWAGNYDFKVASLNASINDSKRYSYDELYAQLEEECIDNVKVSMWYDEGYYQLDEQWMLKYPSRWLHLVVTYGNQFETLYYSEDNNTYYVELDIDGDFLKPLVESITGYYTRDGNTITWKLGHDEFIGTIVENEDGNVEDFQVTKNGEQLPLYMTTTLDNGIDNDTIRFTVGQLELLLDVEITIDQIGMIALMNLK